MARSKTLTIKVKPDVGQDPQVHLDQRSPIVDGLTKKIQWIRDDDAPKFDFLSLAPVTAPLKNPFKDIEVKKNKITCDFEPENEGEEFDYTLTIEFNGVPFNSDEEEDPDGGRAVIRN